MHAVFQSKSTKRSCHVQRFKSRVVVVSSAKYLGSKGLNLDDLHYKQPTNNYKASKAYDDSKLACILFAKEYDRRWVQWHLILTDLTSYLESSSNIQFKCQCIQIMVPNLYLWIKIEVLSKSIVLDIEGEIWKVLMAIQPLWANVLKLILKLASTIVLFYRIASDPFVPITESWNSNVYISLFKCMQFAKSNRLWQISQLKLPWHMQGLLTCRRLITTRVHWTNTLLFLWTLLFTVRCSFYSTSNVHQDPAKMTYPLGMLSEDQLRNLFINGNVKIRGIST